MNDHACHTVKVRAFCYIQVTGAPPSNLTLLKMRLAGAILIVLAATFMGTNAALDELAEEVQDEAELLPTLQRKTVSSSSEESSEEGNESPEDDDSSEESREEESREHEASRENSFEKSSEETNGKL
ncbi:uncharacterized protein [Panulirus ornatus]|uniref:uncharacterized protein n=1 Tax=Panulirus ornatus TaxID=150431 RepID=UPI003A83D52E